MFLIFSVDKGDNSSGTSQLGRTSTAEWKAKMRIGDNLKAKLLAQKEIEVSLINLTFLFWLY